MGNSLPLPLPCACVRHHEAGEVESTASAKRWRRRRKSRPARRRNVRAAARPRHVVPVADTPPPPENGDGGEEEEAGKEGFKEAWRPGCRVETAGCGEDGGGGGVRRVKIVMRRKDIAELVARLEQRDAEERSATVMEPELRHDDLGGDGDGSVNGGSVTMSPCRDAWRPRLSIIPENY